MSKKITLKAENGAPEFIAQGVHDVTLKDGHYHTDNRAFADSIIGNRYATEVEKEDEPEKESDKSEFDKGEKE